MLRGISRLVFCALVFTNVADGSSALTFKIQHIDRKTGNCAGAQKRCAKLTVVYPVAFTGPRSADLVNRKIRQHVRESIEVEERTPTIESAIDCFFRGFWETVKQYPNNTWMHTWEVEIIGSIVYQTPQILSLRILNSGYTGGSHPNEYVEFFNMSPKDGRDFVLADLISDVPAFTMLAERAFREKKGLKPGQSFREADYYFPDNRFQLPEQFGVSAKGIILYFNLYEYTSRATGSTELTIPFATVEPILRPGIHFRQ